MWFDKALMSVVEWLTAIKLRIFPFALSLSKGEWKNPMSQVKPFMLRQAQHERLNLMVVSRMAHHERYHFIVR
jgi:hypothetical protein